MTRVKCYLDYGAFTPIQAAACAALNGPQDIVEKNRELYHKRRDVLVESFGRAGWDIPSPRASMFAWAPLPPALKHLGSLEFSKQLLTHAEVAVAPGVGYGEDGEGYRAHRHGRKRAAAAPGGAQHQALFVEHGGECGGDQVGVDAVFIGASCQPAEMRSGLALSLVAMSVTRQPRLDLSGSR